MSRSPDMLDQSLALEIEEARKLLDSMGDTLAADVDVIARHCTSLQTIDIVMQMLGHIASVVRSKDRKGAVDDIGMHDLKMKLLPAAIEAARSDACEEAA